MHRLPVITLPEQQRVSFCHRCTKRSDWSTKLSDANKGKSCIHVCANI